MSTAGLFTIGVLVTLIVAAAMVPLLYGAVLDGRAQAERAANDRELDAAPHADSILQTARAAGSFATLVEAVHRAGLSDVLEHDGPYTVFAPSDEAFGMLPDGAVEALLGSRDIVAEVVNYHLVPGRMRAADITGSMRAQTLQGEDVLISNNGGVHVDTARLVHGDIEASNGVIHVIDRVLLPARLPAA